MTSEIGKQFRLNDKKNVFELGDGDVASLTVLAAVSSKDGIDGVAPLLVLCRVADLGEIEGREPTATKLIENPNSVVIAFRSSTAFLNHISTISDLGRRAGELLAEMQAAAAGAGTEGSAGSGA